MKESAHTPLSEKLPLPCGMILPNRLCKAAMTEGLAEPDGTVSPELIKLYRRWGEGGAGLLLTGNVQIDRWHLERPGNVIIEGNLASEPMSRLRELALAATANGSHCWVQISHAGRQTQKMVNPHPKAPSAVKLGLPGGQFGQPEALSSAEIAGLVQRFADCARICKEAGFSGVQIHAAHGYLISQFLSPRSNHRDDDYGGSLENRARFLLETFTAVRAAVGSAFPVGVKLNSADFQKGGFAFDDSVKVAIWLQDAGCDLLEISGGTYEQPRLLDVEGIEPVEEQSVKRSTLAREAYFVDFAKAMRARLHMPVMVTGGLRRRDAMEKALASGSADMLGIARPMCVLADAPARLLSGEDELPRYESQLSQLPTWLRPLSGAQLVKVLATFSAQYWYYEQIARLGRGEDTGTPLGLMAATLAQLRSAKRWLKAGRTAGVR